MARVEGIEAVAKSLQHRAELVGAEGKYSVIVGYTAAYAVFVHENIEMKWRGKPRRSGKGSYWDPAGRGQAKFLEAPARTHAKTIAEIVRTALLRGAKMAHALLLGGLRLQRESMLLCPIDTGVLRASAFTKVVQ